ncbi:hypothetical protein ILUMI_07107 [Ignelater luminosus]|uniref:Peptidase M13 N-terminal domain-containing protein n=1 Tax=Ignelater luminosus TaxID=2038154 RepID=A0A8K0GBX4_IGNLU|nr:hypothetical protein ILUMI_07107 [Ignelater luminosus]
MEDFSPNHVLRQLHVKYGVSPYFKVSVEPNPFIPGANSITISPSGLGLPDRSYYYTRQDDPIQKAYKQLIRDVVVYLSVTRIEAEKFGEDMFYYEKRIAEITPHSYEMLNPVNTHNSIKLSELKITAASLPLQDILTALFPESNVTEETEVIVTSPSYLTKVSQITATTDRAIFNSYVIWTLVRKYLPYLSSQFTLTVDSFHSELLGVQHSIPRWEKCSRFVKQCMGLAVESALESQNPIRNKTKTEITNIFQEVSKAVQTRLKEYKISSELKQYLQRKISKLKLQIGLPDLIRKDYLKNYYSKLIILKTNLFESFKNSLSFKRKIEEQLLIAPHSQDKLVFHATYYSTQVSYSAALNTVIVPRAMLTEFIYEDDYPSSILYGRLGVQIANAILSSVLPFDSAWNANSRLLSHYHSIVNESHQSVDSTRSCLTNFVLAHELGLSENSAELTSLSVLKHSSSINIAHQALENYLKDRSHMHQPSLEKLEDSALFFLSYAQTECSRNTKQQELYDSLVNYQLPPKSQLEVAWHQIPEFQTSLECSISKNERCSDIF